MDHFAPVLKTMYEHGDSPKYDDATSLSLLQRARDDDQKAWDDIVHLYGPLVHRWCKRASLRDDDIADVFQDTFRAVAEHLENFQPTRSTGSFRSWLRSIVRSKVADHFRRSAQQPSGRGGSDAQLHLANVVDPWDDENDPETAEEVEEENALVVQRAMELIQPEFTDQNWRAFLKVTVEGHSAVDVARGLGVNPQTVRQAAYRIRRRLRVVLADLME